MDMFDFAGLLFGGNRNRPEATTVTATGAAASDDGVASITLDADVTPAEDVGEDADQTVIDLPTSPDVAEGDEVIVTLVGDGPLKTPVVTSNPGSGDRMRALANSAKTVANAAQAVAQAVGQHFWSADDGIHVTEATQDEWDESHSGANVLINSIGQLFRDGLTNLLTLTTENGARALTIWDGLGNTAANVLATFSANGISFADGTSFDIGDTSAYINFDGDGHISIGGSGLTIGGYATDDDVADAVDGISVGGRNLLRNTGNPTASDLAFTRATVQDGIIIITPTTSAGYAKFKVDYLDFADYGEGEYTFSFDAKAVSGATYTNLKGPVAYAGFNVASRMSNASFSSSYDRYKSWTLSPTLTYDWTRYAQTFTVPDDLTTGQASALASGSNLTVVVAMTGSYAPMMVRNVKLERGNKATDWTAAPEDIDAAITDASKTATSYVTEITGQNGIMVHPSTDDDTGVRITSDVDIMRDGYSVINVGTQGDTSGNTDAGVTIYDGTTNENVVATFDGDGIGLVGDAFRLSATKTVEELGEESNPTTVTEYGSKMNMERSDDTYTVRSHFDSGASLAMGPYAYSYTGSGIVMASEVEDASGNILASNEFSMGADPDHTYMRGTANDIAWECDGYMTLSAKTFVITDEQMGACIWSTAPGTILWSSGGWAMAANQTATLAYNVSTCPTGIVLHWQPYTSSTVRDYYHHWQFIPKEQVTSYAGTTANVTLSSSKFASVATKTLYVSNNRVTGHADNTATGTANGITYANNQWVLTQIIAV